MKIIKYFSLLIILISIFLSAEEEKKRDYVKIPKNKGWHLSWIIDIIILNNRLNFAGKNSLKMTTYDWRDFASDYDSYKKIDYQMLADLAEEAGLNVESKEEYEQKYAHLKTAEEKASEVIKNMKFPENPNFAELSDEKEIDTCKTCIDLLKKYSDVAEFLLSERNTKKGSLSYHVVEREHWWKTSGIMREYNRKDCPKILNKISFDQQIENTSGITFKKIYKAFELLTIRYHGLSNPFSW